MKYFFKQSALAMSMAMLAGTATAHDIDEAGTPVCLEGNYMMADAQNAPFASASGPGRVIEMNIITGTPGITVAPPFSGANAGTGICPDGVVCPGPWKPTGVLSGGENGHAFITSAGQQALTEFHRDGTPIRSVSYKALLGNPTTGPGAGIGAGTVPRPLGTQLMPNGNLIQAICDANFFNASNSDVDADVTRTDPATGETSNNASWKYFPPVFTTPERNSNSRLLVIDQVTMEVIDEYSQPKKGELGHDLWGCFAGIMFSDEGMFVSTFHGGAVLAIDWMDGIDKESRGVGANVARNCGNSSDDDGDNCTFKLGKKKNQAKVTVKGVPDEPGVAARLFTQLAESNINIDMIIQNVGEDGRADISFTVPTENLALASSILENGIVDGLGATSFSTDESIGRVSVVGAGMKSNPGVAATMFETLADRGINIEMISTSAIRISCVISSTEVEAAVAALHTAFGLDAD